MPELPNLTADEQARQEWQRWTPDVGEEGQRKLNRPAFWCRDWVALEALRHIIWRQRGSENMFWVTRKM